MVTIIKHTLPLEEAEQPHLGEGTKTLTTRICLSNKLLLLNNIYRVDGDITTPLTREPRSMIVGDFYARDERWCRDHNRAGHLLKYQLKNLNNFCLINHPLWTTINKTTINLSILPVASKLVDISCTS